MNIYEFLFAVALLASLGITLYKFYNVMHKCEKYDLRMTFILFVGFLFAWGITLVISMMMVNVVGTGEYIIYSALFKFNSLFLLVNVLFLIAEILINLGYFATGYIDSYKSNEIKYR